MVADDIVVVVVAGDLGAILVVPIRRGNGEHALQGPQEIDCALRSGTGGVEGAEGGAIAVDAHLFRGGEGKGGEGGEEEDGEEDGKPHCCDWGRWEGL